MYNGEFKGRIKVMILVLFCPNSKYSILYIVPSPEIMWWGNPETSAKRPAVCCISKIEKACFLTRSFVGHGQEYFVTQVHEYQNSSYTASILGKKIDH